MKKLLVRTKDKTYPIVIEKNIIKKFGLIQKKILPEVNKILIITSSNIPKKYIHHLKKNIKKNIFTKLIVLSYGEKIKSNKTIIKIDNLLSANNFDRKDLVVALGGGVIGDLAGFAASIFKRGISFVQIPTTLLSQVDSSVGGKTGINNSFGKNLIGTFYQPDFVLIDTETLRTLPKRELIAGSAEILKYSLIMNKKFFNWLNINFQKIILQKNDMVTEKAIYESCKCKSVIVKKDEKEKNIRAILNFGHTFGHALETFTGYSKKLIHGEAVFIGMLVAAKISNSMGFLSKKELEKIEQFYKNHKIPYQYSSFIKKKDLGKLLKIMEKDKKVETKKIKLILLKTIGKAIIKKSDIKKAFLPILKKAY